MDERLLTPDQLAEKLSVPLSWVYSRTRSGEIPTIRAGKYCRFSLPEVMAWLKKNNEAK